MFGCADFESAAVIDRVSPKCITVSITHDLFSFGQAFLPSVTASVKGHINRKGLRFPVDYHDLYGCDRP